MYKCPICGAELTNVDEAGPMIRGFCSQHGIVKCKRQ